MGDDQDPGERVRKLVQFAGQVHVDNSIAPKKYFRSGIEMEKMVSLYSVVHKLTTGCRQISQAGARFSKLPVITGPVKLFCFPF